MIILAFDCATVRHSAAVWQDGRVLARATSERAHGATEALVPMLERVLRESALDFGRIDRLAVTVGPGHFTGLRAGLAVARALVLATGLPVVAITTFEALAAAVPAGARQGRRLLVAIDSKRAEPYLQMLDSEMAALADAAPQSPEAYAASLSRGSPILVVGDAGPALAAALRQAGHDASLADAAVSPDAAVLASLAATRLPLTGAVRPYYLHPPAVRLPAGTEPPQ